MVQQLTWSLPVPAYKLSWAVPISPFLPCSQSPPGKPSPGGNWEYILLTETLEIKRQEIMRIFNFIVLKNEKDCETHYLGTFCMDTLMPQVTLPVAM